MGVTAEPPIFIDPSVDDGHKWAFVNQNFQNLADAVNKNGFVIVKSGSVDLVQSTSSNPGAGLFASDTATLGSAVHNLGYIPAVIAYMDFSTGVRVALPYTSNNTSGATSLWNTYFPVVSSASLTIRINRTVYGGPWSTVAPPVSVKYFLLQQSAS